MKQHEGNYMIAIKFFCELTLIISSGSSYKTIKWSTFLCFWNHELCFYRKKKNKVSKYLHNLRFLLNCAFMSCIYENVFDLFEVKLDLNGVLFHYAQFILKLYMSGWIDLWYCTSNTLFCCVSVHFWVLISPGY